MIRIWRWAKAVFIHDDFEAFDRASHPVAELQMVKNLCLPPAVLPVLYPKALIPGRNSAEEINLAHNPAQASREAVDETI